MGDVFPTGAGDETLGHDGVRGANGSIVPPALTGFAVGYCQHARFADTLAVKSYETSYLGGKL